MLTYKTKGVLLASIGGIVLGLSYLAEELVPLSFLAFAMLFIVHKHVCGESPWSLGLSTFAFIISWNITATIWFYHNGVSPVSAFCGQLANSFFYLVVLAPYFILYKKIKHVLAQHLLFAVLWIAMEFIHHHWELAHPMLTLGYIFGYFPSWIQWYAYTGVLGGSLWLFFINMSIVYVLDKSIVGISLTKGMLCMGLAIIPFMVSLLMFDKYQEKSDPIKVVATHAYINWQTEKYKWPVRKLLDLYVSLSKSKISKNTDVLLWNETALTNIGNLSDIQHEAILSSLRDTFASHPDLSLITGFLGYENKLVGNTNVLKKYNSIAMIRGGTDTVQVRSKQHLVPFSEGIPYKRYMKWLKNFMPDLGDIDTRNSQDKVVFKLGTYHAAVLICYEIAFSQLLIEAVNNKANVIFLSSSEGMYDDLRGAKQFLNVTKIRAIESRRSVVCASSDGISALVNQLGVAEAMETRFLSTAIAGQVNLNSESTFFCQHGDIIGQLCMALFLCATAMTIFTKGLEHCSARMRLLSN